MSYSQGRQRTEYRRVNNNSDYVYGNAVRKAAPVRTEKQLRRVEHANRRNRDKARHMNFGYVMFLSIALFLTAMTLLGYIKARSELTVSIKNVAKLESELHTLTLTNDENLDRINEAVNVEDIKRIAVEELGMSYAKEGQVIVIEDEGSDYVRQLQELQ